MKRKIIILAIAGVMALAMATGCSGNASGAGIKANPQEAQQQVEAALQNLVADAYGDKVDDLRVTSVKVYSAEEEQADELLKSYGLGDDEVAFTVEYELHPAAGTDVNELMAGTGRFDEESGWVVEKGNVGILRPNAEGDPAYVITDFGTGF